MREKRGSFSNEEMMFLRRGRSHFSFLLRHALIKVNVELSRQEILERSLLFCECCYGSAVLLFSPCGVLSAYDGDGWSDIVFWLGMR